MMEFRKAAAGVGMWLIAMGAAVSALSIGRSSDGVGVGEIVTVCGVATVLSWFICREVHAVNRPADVAFTQGFEMGHDIGWREGFMAAQPEAPVVKLERRDAVDRKATEWPVPSRMA